MPEGDSVFRAAAQLHAALAGQQLISSDFRVPRFATLKLGGWTVTEVVPRGKHLLMRVEGPARERGGSPAEKAGLKGGDVIVEFAGQKIVNIYDYTYALDAVKIGQPVTIVVERDGQRATLTATPEARK